MPGKIEIQINGTQIHMDLNMEDGSSDGEIMVGQLLAREVEETMNAPCFQLLAMMCSSPSVMMTRDGMMPVAQAVAKMIMMAEEDKE